MIRTVTMTEYFASSKQHRADIDEFINDCGVNINVVREFVINDDTVTFTVLVKDGDSYVMNEAGDDYEMRELVVDVPVTGVPI